MNTKTTAAIITALISLTPQAFAKTFAIDVTQSHIQWTGKKVVGQQHQGTVTVQSGQVELNGNNLTGGEIIIDMASIKNEDLKDAEYNAKLTGHLKSDDFFSVAQHPTSKFKITSVKKLKNNKKATHEVTGHLTIKDATHPVTFLMKIELNSGVAIAKGKIVIDRTKYNIRYGSGKFFENLGDKMISDDFELDIDLKSKI